MENKKIAGLADLQNLQGDRIDAEAAYDRASNRGYPAREAATLKRIEAAYIEAKKLYPIAAAWIRADAFEAASNYAKSAAGQRAKKRIDAGEDYNGVLADMDAEWKSAAAGMSMNS